jgi:phospholipid-binding lipoprotein MlaA
MSMSCAPGAPNKKGIAVAQYETLSKRARLLGLALAAAGVLGGCASSGNPKDPLEGYNRAMFAVNEGIDKVVLKPVAQGYEAAVPLPGRVGVSNFISNLNEIVVIVNNLLQGKPADALSDTGRLLVNSTLGIGGLFDVASEMGLQKHEEDFGQTLGRWGWQESSYFVLPLMGPRTVRDTLGFGVDVATSVVLDVEDVGARNTLIGLFVVSNRAALLPVDKVIEQAATDKYAYVRDAYLQRRRSLIFDGSPPREKLDEGALPGPAHAALHDLAWAPAASAESGARRH